MLSLLAEFVFVLHAQHFLEGLTASHFTYTDLTLTITCLYTWSDCQVRAINALLQCEIPGRSYWSQSTGCQCGLRSSDDLTQQSLSFLLLLDHKHNSRYTVPVKTGQGIPGKNVD